MYLESQPRSQTRQPGVARVPVPKLLTLGDLRRAIPRRGVRGLGAAWVFSVSPGDPCYDPSHDNGDTHYRLWFPGMDTAELACTAGGPSIILQNPGALTPGLPVGYDPTTGLIDTSNTTGETVVPSAGQIASAFTAIVPDQSSVDTTAFWSQWGGAIAVAAGLAALWFVVGRK